jgi:hypothetical protein
MVKVSYCLLRDNPKVSGFWRLANGDVIICYFLSGLIE